MTIYQPIGGQHDQYAANQASSTTLNAICNHLQSRSGCFRSTHIIVVSSLATHHNFDLHKTSIDHHLYFCIPSITVRIILRTDSTLLPLLLFLLLLLPPLPLSLLLRCLTFMLRFPLAIHLWQTRHGSIFVFHLASWCDRWCSENICARRSLSCSCCTGCQRGTGTIIRGSIISSVEIAIFSVPLGGCVFVSAAVFLGILLVW